MSATFIMSILALSGCGGSSGAKGPLLTRSQLAARGNPICATHARRINDGAKVVFPHPDQAGIQDAGLIATYANQYVLPELQKEHDELGALGSSTDLTFPAALTEPQKGIDKWSSDKTLMASVNDTTFASFDGLANDLGLTVCAGTDGTIRAIASGSITPR